MTRSHYVSIVLGVLVLFVIGYAGTLVWANDAEKTDASSRPPRCSND